MKISTKGIYALEVAVDLAMNASEKNRVSIRSVAERRQLSDKYLERIVSMLKKSGIVKSSRGAYGGYCLARPADQITALEVLEAAEGNLAPVECLTNQTDCGIACEECPTRETWGKIWDLLKSSIRNVTIQDIRDLAEAKKKAREEVG
jgi:Rrf2 family protein